MFQTGDVVGFRSEEAGKKKYHLCVCSTGYYLFMNSRKQRSFPGDFIVPASTFPYLPQETDCTVISCMLVMKKSYSDLARLRAQKLGSAPVDVLRRLLVFIENDESIPDETKEKILDGLGAYL